MAESKNVRVAVTGAVYVGPTSATPPSDANSTVNGMSDLGFVSDDGVTETRDRETETIKAWQDGATVREIVKSGDISFKMTLLETSKAVLEAFYGAEVTAEDQHGTLVVNPSQTGGRHSFIIDIIDGEEFIRIWIPEAEITEVGEQKFASGEAIGYEITIKAYQTKFDGKAGAVKKFYSSLKKTTP